jgi:site-specific DNA-methyltransferase (adenine-specific)
MVEHVCAKCEKIFKQKSQLDAHKNRKTPCKKDVTIEKIVEKKVEEILLTRLPQITVPPRRNELIIGNNIDVMRSMNSESIDMIVTSPPYDNMRTYKGNYAIDLHALGAEMFRILKPGGICGMVIQDQTVDGCKTLTTFRTTLDYCDNIGFSLFEACIYKKLGNEGAWWTKRFRVDHEYILMFMKGSRPAYFNKEDIKIPSKHANRTMTGCATRKTDGETLPSVKVTINPTKCPGTIWDHANGGDKNKLKRKHPAVFPDKLAYNLIQVFCPPDGIVLDPMSGSGTTVIQAQKLGRQFVGIDIEPEYMNICKERFLSECALTIDARTYSQEQTAPPQ